MKSDFSVAVHALVYLSVKGCTLSSDALADKPAASLVATILQGRPGTPMPPFLGLLGTEEITWIVERLQEGFPPLPAGSSSH